MQVTGSTTVTSSAPSVGSTSQIAALQKQLQTLTQKVKDLSTNSSLDAKTKQVETQLLQAQIAAVQAQIQAIEDQQQQTQINKAAQAATKNMTKPPDSTKPKNVVTATLVDVYA